MMRRACNDTYWILRLLNIPGLGNVKVRKILDFCRSRGLSISTFTENIIHSVEKTALLNPSQLSALLHENRMVDEQWEEMQRCDIQTLIFGSPDYPANRMTVLNNNAPVLLFLKGNISLLNKTSIGFCGARKASEKGLNTAWDCADQMARKDVNIVSGYAAGVDMTTHKAALDAGGSTTIVLAEGILNFRIKKSIAGIFDYERVLVVSEFLPKLPWSVRNAMQRNATICALSDAMILIEAEERGGSVSAGRTCLGMRRPLFAPVYEGMPESASGNRILLADGAQEIKKSRQTGRANLTPVEEVLFRAKEEDHTYQIEKTSNYEQQLGLFEKPADYIKPEKNA